MNGFEIAMEKMEISAIELTAAKANRDVNAMLHWWDKWERARQEAMKWLVAA